MTPKNKVENGFISWEDNFFVQKNYLCGNICYDWKTSMIKFHLMCDEIQQSYLKDFWKRIYLICRTELKILFYDLSNYYKQATISNQYLQRMQH